MLRQTPQTPGRKQVSVSERHDEIVVSFGPSRKRKPVKSIVLSLYAQHEVRAWKHLPERLLQDLQLFSFVVTSGKDGSDELRMTAAQKEGRKS